LLTDGTSWTRIVEAFIQEPFGQTVDPGAAEFGRRRRILCVSRKSAEKNSAKPYD